MLLFFGTAMMLADPLRAEISFGDVWGTAWTIGNVITGETTITPKYAVTDWTSHIDIHWTTNGQGKWFFQYGTYKYHRDLLGNVSYRTSAQIIRGATVPPSNAPFPIESVNQMNMTCDGYSTNANTGEVIHSTSVQLESHKETMWLDSVTSTGLWPEDGPWTVWLKTSGQKCNCNGPRNIPNYYFWTSASLSKGGQ